MALAFSLAVSLMGFCTSCSQANTLSLHPSNNIKPYKCVSCNAVLAPAKMEMLLDQTRWSAVTYVNGGSLLTHLDACS